MTNPQSIRILGTLLLLPLTAVTIAPSALAQVVGKEHVTPAKKAKKSTATASAPAATQPEPAAAAGSETGNPPTESAEAEKAEAEKAPVYRADLGERPDENGQPLTGLDDPSEENLTLPKWRQLKQTRLAFVKILERIWISPLMKALEARSRRVAHDEYRARIASPGGFGVFAVNAAQGEPTPDTTTTFVNEGTEYEGVAERDLGVCWGQTTMNRRFAKLAFFSADESTAAPADRLPDPTFSRPLFVRELIRRVNSVMAGNAEYFPGIRNVRELTLVPEVERHLKVLVVRTWADLAIRPWEKAFFASTKNPMTEFERTKMIADVEARVARHELPKLMFTARTSALKLGVPTWIHTVLVTGIERVDGVTYLNVWDPDFYGEELSSSPRARSLEIRVDGTILYRPWYEAKNKEWSDRIGQFYYTPDNDAETLMLEKSMSAFCGKYPELCFGVRK